MTSARLHPEYLCNDCNVHGFPEPLNSISSDTQIDESSSVLVIRYSRALTISPVPLPRRVGRLLSLKTLKVAHIVTRFRQKP
jgi:hypothetical protein